MSRSINALALSSGMSRILPAWDARYNVWRPVLRNRANKRLGNGWHGFPLALRKLRIADPTSGISNAVFGDKIVQSRLRVFGEGVVGGAQIRKLSKPTNERNCPCV